MSKPLRFLFDECIGKPVMIELMHEVESDIEFIHMVDWFGRGSKDPNWIPNLSKSRHCIVITTDGGRNSRRGDKLPLLCRLHGITHLIISPALHRKSSREKFEALVILWKQIEGLFLRPAGSCFKLQYVTGKSGSLTHAITEHPAKKRPKRN